MRCGFGRLGSSSAAFTPCYPRSTVRSHSNSAATSAGSVTVDEALDRLTAKDTLAGEIVRLLYFAGLTWPEIAEVTSISERDLHRHWAFARAWLRDAMEKQA